MGWLSKRKAARKSLARRVTVLENSLDALFEDHEALTNEVEDQRTGINTIRDELSAEVDGLRSDVTDLEQKED